VNLVPKPILDFLNSPGCYV